ncbi:MAG: hypothetical protein WBB45_04170 [Cyclobacteriaceae bacterium]
MAVLPKNHPMYGASGRVGDYVYKTSKDKTVVAYYPRQKNQDAGCRRRRTPENDRFSEAVTYAQTQLATEAGRAFYQKNLNGARSPFNAAMSDYLTRQPMHGQG